MFQDLNRNAGFIAGHAPRLARYVATCATIRYQAVLLYRISSKVGRFNRFFGSVVKHINHVWSGADIAWQADIGSGLVLFHPSGVVIGADVIIGTNCEIQQGVSLGGSGRLPHGEPDSPVIGCDVKVGAGAKILGKLAVGSDVFIGANAVVLHDVPDHSIAIGVPASVRMKGS